MIDVLTLLPAVVPNPIDEGTLRPGLEPSQVTPGLVGFLASLLLAVAVILLVLDFNRRNRRLRYRAEYAERRAAEERVGGYADRAEGEVPGEGGTEPGATPGPDDPSSAGSSSPGPPTAGASPDGGTPSEAASSDAAPHDAAPSDDDPGTPRR